MNTLTEKQIQAPPEETLAPGGSAYPLSASRNSAYPGGRPGIAPVSLRPAEQTTSETHYSGDNIHAC
jgi:hypothetical protein